jgi:hypothetical protein
MRSKSPNVLGRSVRGFLRAHPSSSRGFSPFGRLSEMHAANRAFFREQTLKVINLLVGNGSSIAMELDESDHPFGSQHCWPCRIWVQSDEHISAEQRHRNNRSTDRSLQAGEEMSGYLYSAVALPLPLEPVSSLDGIPWQAPHRLRSQIIVDCCHYEQQAAGQSSVN